MIIDDLPIIAIALPLIGAFATPLFNVLGEKVGNSRVRDFFSLAILVGTALAVFGMAPDVFGGEVIVYQLAGRIPPWGINLAIDGLNIIVAMVVSGVSVLAMIYSLIFMDREGGLGRYYTLLLLLVAGMMGISLTGDIFNLYVFFEIMSIASYALTAFYRTGESLEGAFKYLVMGTLGTALILLGIAILYGLTGTLNFADLAVRLNAINAAHGGFPISMVVALGFFITGFGIKIAMVPLHAWLPDAYQTAPSSIVSVFAGGTAIVGVYSLLRISYFPFGALDVGTIFIGLGLVSMVLGALMALAQEDLKRLLAYSGISQMGYILLGVGLGTALGIQGGLFHLLNNAIYKSLLFLGAGAVIYQVGTSNLNKLGGLGNKMPITAATFIIGALAISGIPPFNGFASKWTIYVAGIEAGYPILTIIAVVISALTLAYFVKAISQIFLGQRPEHLENVKEVSPVMLFPMLVLAILCIVLGILPHWGIDLVEPAQNALMNNAEYIQAVLGGI
jgi:multicomponent Na+:H+ antiporter subunit D